MGFAWHTFPADSQRLYSNVQRLEEAPDTATDEEAFYAHMEHERNWQMADDGTMDVVIHCTNCGHEERFSSDTGNVYALALHFLNTDGECTGLDQWESIAEGADDITDCAQQREIHAQIVARSAAPIDYNALAATMVPDEIGPKWRGR